MSLRSSIGRFAQLRRGLPLVAAGLLLAALAVPMWRITLSAPQYVKTLMVEVYAYPHMSGDYAEVHGLNKYVGFHYPDPVFVTPNFPVHEASVAVPEWILGPVAFVVLAATGVFVALAPTDRKLRLGLACQLAGTVAVLTAMFAIIQYRLYQAGHSLDPSAPLQGVDGFTPPVLGSYEVANISGFAWFGPGGYLTVLAVVLLAVAYRFRGSEATFGDVPRLLRGIRRGTGDRGEEPTASSSTGSEEGPTDSNAGNEKGPIRLRTESEDPTLRRHGWW